MKTNYPGCDQFGEPRPPTPTKKGQVERIVAWALAGLMGIVCGLLWSQLENAKDEIAKVRNANQLIVTIFEPKKSLDDVCPAWLFNTSVHAARERICKGR